ncbi:dentin sialophosphoprotein [Parasteatoda tepidariorum]|uniref:dentin sialophosphoprotein n=1 Tax=Parasteatoda tepidariorum TaxID=114398 RepID=UPI001C71E931|nr:uncharacterized protein LOC107448619 [Parasteatoda tepidariorum]
MSDTSCPKTCDLLSVATILFSIGIVQLLAGIILLKSENVYVLAGTDFAVAATNILVGSLLGIAASVWEKKKKVASCKRQNVLACLYIAALSMNATGAIIMILGDGNKLLISKDKENVSKDFMFEITACAYVTSVCSPIVCLVIALVCLSGIRIQIHDNMKKKNSITKAESYGWVFENNHDSRSRNLGALLQDSSNQNASVSDDNVFLDQRSATKKLLKVKPSKKTKSRDSVTSVSELKTPLEIWTHKRNKMIKEITSPQPIFFADDYLQFPDFKYDSYIGFKIPRITETSFIRPGSRGSNQTESSTNLERQIDKIEKTMSCKPSKPHLDELNNKLASRRLSYPDSAHLVEKFECNEEELENLPQTALEDHKKSIDETDSQTSHPTHPKLQRTQANLNPKIAPKHLKQQSACFDSEAICSPELPSESSIVGSLDWLQGSHKARRNSNDSGSSGLTAETISELKAKINKMSFAEDESPEQNKEFLRSFKQDGKRKSHLSESDVGCNQSAFQKLHAKYAVFSQNSESDSKTTLAGEVVPISVRPTAINRANSIPVKTICSQTANRYSVDVKNISSDQRLDMDSDDSKFLPANGESQSSQRTYPFSNSYKEKSTHKSDTESINSSKHSEEKCHFKQRMSIMGSIAESPTEEFLQVISESEKSDRESYNSPPKTNNDRDSPTDGPRLAKNSFSLKRFSSKAAPNLLNRLWSMKRSETKTDFSSLIMDSDSLVGLNDEELMARTRRIRQLRKSVELRSQLEKHDDVV